MHFYQKIIKNAIQVTGHYSVHIGLAPSFRLTGLKVSLQSGSIIIKNIYPRPHNCCAFCQTLIAPNLTSIRCFRIPSLTLPIIYCIDKKKAGCSRRVRIVAPHIPHVLYAFTYSIVKVRQAESLLPSVSFHDLISHKSTQGKTVVKLLVCFL